MSVYRHPHVAAVQAAYGTVLRERGASVPEHADRLAAKAAAMVGHPAERTNAARTAVLVEWRNYLPDWIGLDETSALERLQSLGSDALRDTARACWARQFGFADWGALVREQPVYHAGFEDAVDALLDGELDRLRAALAADPLLARRASTLGHKATLLHYAAANGVALWRQQVPGNLLDGVRLLLAAGTDRHAEMQVYGGGHTAHALAASSAHPKAAGVLEALLDLLDPAG